MEWFWNLFSRPKPEGGSTTVEVLQLNTTNSGVDLTVHWTDYLGLIGVGLTVLFGVSVIVALVQGTDPMKLVREIGRALRVVVRAGKTK